MRIFLLFCVLCLMTCTGYGQSPGDHDPKKLHRLPGLPGRRGLPISPRIIGPPGPPGPPGPAAFCGRDIFGSIIEEIEALQKSLAKVELTMTYDFVRRVGQKYFVSNKEKSSFSRAAGFCSQQGLEMALPQNDEENKILTQEFADKCKNIWINVNNKAEGNFKADMKNQPLTFTKWEEGQPDKSIQETGCTMLLENGVWRVTPECSFNACIICQI